MENYEDEEIVRIILFRHDFVDAIKYFEYSKNVNDKFIRDGLIKMGIVTYAKPFMENTGIHKEVKKYRLPKSMIPDDFMWLHEIFMNYRGNFIGHSNFKTIKPSMRDPQETPKGKMISTQYTGITFEHWFEVDEEFPEEPMLVDQAIELVNTLIKDIPRAYTTEEVFSGNLEVL